MNNLTIHDMRKTDAMGRAAVSKTSAQKLLCGWCGVENKADSMWCFYCGTAQPAPEAPAERFDDGAKGGTRK